MVVFFTSILEKYFLFYKHSASWSSECLETDGDNIDRCLSHNRPFLKNAWKISRYILLQHLNEQKRTKQQHHHHCFSFHLVSIRSPILEMLQSNYFSKYGLVAFLSLFAALSLRPTRAFAFPTTTPSRWSHSPLSMSQQSKPVKNPCRLSSWNSNCGSPSRGSLVVYSASSPLTGDDSSNDDADALLSTPADNDKSKLTFRQRLSKVFSKKDVIEEDEKLPLRQRLAKMGLACVLSYGFVSNMNYSITISLSWFVFSKRVRTCVSLSIDGQSINQWDSDERTVLPFVLSPDMLLPVC